MPISIANIRRAERELKSAVDELFSRPVRRVKMGRRVGRPVTEVEVWLFWEAYRELRSFAKVGELCRRSQGTVHSCLRDAGFIEVEAGHRHRLSEEEVEELAADYRRLRSIRRVADRCGRTQQSVWDILHRRGLTLPPHPGHEKVMYKGEAFTVGKNGYLRSTRFATRKAGAARLLHRVIWEEANGPVPAGHVIAFKDEDRNNCALENLECLTRGEQRRRCRSANAWTVFYEVHDHLLGEWQDAIAAAAPAAEIERARMAYERLERPNTWTPERSATHRELMRRRWAAIPKEERRRRALAIHAKRRAKRETQFGNVVDHLLEAAA